MLVLALDTTTRYGSCALTRGRAVLREERSDAAQPPASRLPGELMALLDATRTALADVDVFAVATGPGSFTGLRVGIATMQGLAFASGKPLVGVSAFDALASFAGESASAAPQRIATWVDAWRGEVYAALYEGGTAIADPIVAPPDVLLPALRGRAVTFVGDGAAAFRDRILETLAGDAMFADPLTPALAGAIARLAVDAIEAGDRPPPHAIRPVYVRRPDPELARDARLPR